MTRGGKGSTKLLRHSYLAGVGEKKLAAQW